MVDIGDFYSKLLVYDFEKGFGIPVIRRNRHTFFQNDFMNTTLNELEEMIFNQVPIGVIVEKRPSDNWQNSPTVNKLFDNWNLPERSSLYNVYRLSLQHDYLPVLYRGENQIIGDNIGINGENVDSKPELGNYILGGISNDNYHIYNTLKTILISNLSLDLERKVFFSQINRKILVSNNDDEGSSFDNAIISGLRNR